MKILKRIMSHYENCTCLIHARNCSFMGTAKTDAEAKALLKHFNMPFTS